MSPIAFAAFQPAEHRTLHDHAYAQMRNALMTGRFEPGQKITIRGLSGALGISPTPVREAVRRLAAEGAIEMQPNAWMKIPLLSAEALRELRDIRTALEGLATERAASRITADEVAALHEIDDSIRALRGTGDIKSMIVRIHRFHHSVYAAARMPALTQMIEGLWLRSGPYVNLLFTGYTKEERGRLRAKTLAALDRRDAARARASMEADVGRALDYLIDYVTDHEAAETRNRRPSRTARRR